MGRFSHLHVFICDYQEEGIDTVEDLIKSGKEHPEIRLKEVIHDLAQGCFNYCQLMKDVDLTSSGKTKLDYERHNLCWKEMVRFLNRFMRVYHFHRRVNSSVFCNVVFRHFDG